MKLSKEQKKKLKAVMPLLKEIRKTTSKTKYFDTHLSVKLYGTDVQVDDFLKYLEELIK